MSNQKKLFPKYLEKGATAKGAVAILQILLITHGHAEEGMVVNGIFDEEVEEAVKNLQIYVGFKGEEVDGKFGPATREKLRIEYNIDVNKIQKAFFEDDSRKLLEVPNANSPHEDADA